MNAMRAEQVNKNHLNPSTVSHNSSSLFFALFPFPSEFSIAISPLAIGHPASHIPFLFENARNLTPFSFFGLLYCSFQSHFHLYTTTSFLLFRIILFEHITCDRKWIFHQFISNQWELFGVHNIYTLVCLLLYLSLFYFVSHYMCVVSVVMFICIADGHHFCLFCFSMLFRQRFQRFLFTCCIWIRCRICHVVIWAALLWMRLLYRDCGGEFLEIIEPLEIT